MFDASTIIGYKYVIMLGVVTRDVSSKAQFNGMLRLAKYSQPQGRQCGIPWGLGSHLKVAAS